MGYRSEVRRLPEWLDGAGPKVNLTLFAVILGVILPWTMGFQYLDPVILIGVSLACVVFPAAVAGSAGAEVEAQEIPPRVLAIATGGLVYALVVTLAGFATLNLLNWYGHILLPDALSLATLPLLPLSLSAFLGAEGVRLSRIGHRPREIGARFRWSALLLVTAWYFRSYWMPAAVRDAIDTRLTTPAIALATLILSAAFGVGTAAIVGRLRRQS